MTRAIQDATARPWSSRAVLVLLLIAFAMSAIFYHWSRLPEFNHHVPEFIALALASGALYLAGVCVTERFTQGWPALLVILAAAGAFRLILLPANPPLSDDVYRYQWEGKVQALSFNPYTVYPAQSGLQKLQNPRRPLRTGATTPTVYPPLSELSFTWVSTIRGYKILYAAFDLATLGVLLGILASLQQPLYRVLVYAWNPAVIISFSLCSHQDSLAIFTLMLACLLIVRRKFLLSNVFLALSFASKFFAILFLPLFLKRPRRASVGAFAGVVLLCYLPFISAGRELFHGFINYAARWQDNDSLFRVIRAASASRPQAEFVAGILVLAVVACVVRSHMPVLRSGLFLTASLLLLSPNAFPWYFTWSVPFLCFYPSAPWLLMSVTCVLGYAPVIAYAAGQPYRDSPLILILEYAPVLAWLLWKGLKDFAQPERDEEVKLLSSTQAAD
ncbi:MAG: glycosyltransferase 87 family protein [Terriglobia bacterium]